MSEAVEFVESVIAAVGPRSAAIADVLDRVSLENGAHWRDVIGPSQRHFLMPARRAVARALHFLDPPGGEITLVDIGLVLGGRSHPTILYYLGRTANGARFIETRLDATGKKLPLNRKTRAVS